MTDRPILFSAPMIRAILEGRKTQTRRVLKPRGPNVIVGCYEWNNAARAMLPIPRYAVGDRLWVREALHRNPVTGIVNYDADGVCLFDATAQAKAWKRDFRPGIHMPRWASRITLIVTDVRVQRLVDISCADAIAEGIAPAANSQTIDCDTPDPRDGFRSLWDSINASRPECSWSDNPWVCAVSFRVVKANIDQAEAA